MSHIMHQLQLADRLSAITQKVGFALWQLQELEGVSAQYFVLLVQAEKGMGLNEANALIEKAQHKTFGATIHQLTRAGLLSLGLDTRFTNLLAERNWLVHKSRASSRSAIHSDTSMNKLISRLDAIADESLALIKEVAVLVDRFVKIHGGITEQQINEKTNQLLEEWHASDAS